MTTADGAVPRVCARAGCGTALVRSSRGRPRRYCSAACRLAAARQRLDAHLAVELDCQRDDGQAGRPTGHVWLVRLRRGERVVEVATGLGRPSADYLARQLRELIEPRHDVQPARPGKSTVPDAPGRPIAEPDISGDPREAPSMTDSAGRRNPQQEARCATTHH